MVTPGPELFFFYAITALSGIALGLHLIHITLNFPHFGKLAKFLSVINLGFLMIFSVLSLFVHFHVIYIFFTAALVISNVVVLKKYVK